MACLKHVRECWARSVQGSHDNNVFRDSVEVLEARPGQVKVRMNIQQQHLNGAGNVHGGVIMTLVDDITWLALQTLGDKRVHTVSSNMSAEFVRPCGRLGDELIMIAEAVKKGRRLGFLRITFYQKGEICAFGTQTVAVNPNSPVSTFKFSEDGSELIPLEPKQPSAKL